jgi:hypothetical protein
MLTKMDFVRLTVAASAQNSEIRIMLPCLLRSSAVKVPRPMPMASLAKDSILSGSGSRCKRAGLRVMKISPLTVSRLAL